MHRALLLAVLLVTARPAAAQAPTCDLRLALEHPRVGASVGAGTPIAVEGWAVDRAAPAGTGILSVQVTLDVPRAAGGTAFVALHAEQRPDVAQLLGDERFLFSGYRVDVPTVDLETGLHTLYVEVLTRCGWHTETREVLVLPPGETVAYGPGAGSPT